MHFNSQKGYRDIAKGLSLEQADKLARGLLKDIANILISVNPQLTLEDKSAELAISQSSPQ